MGKIRRPRTNHSNTIPRGETVDVFLRKKKLFLQKKAHDFIRELNRSFPTDKISR